MNDKETKNRSKYISPYINISSTSSLNENEEFKRNENQENLYVKINEFVDEENFEEYQHISKEKLSKSFSSLISNYNSYFDETESYSVNKTENKSEYNIYSKAITIKNNDKNYDIPEENSILQKFNDKYNFPIVSKRNPLDEYVIDIIKHLKETEEQHKPNFNEIFEKNSLYNKDIRKKILLKILSYFNYFVYPLTQETIYLIFNLIDLMSYYYDSLSDKFELISVACVFIAGKYEEIYPPELSDYLKLIKVRKDRRKYTTDDLLEAENLILDNLKFDLNFCSPYDFLNLFYYYEANSNEFIKNKNIKIEYNNDNNYYDNIDILYTAMYFLEILYITCENFYTKNPSIQASIALYLSKDFYHSYLYSNGRNIFILNKVKNLEYIEELRPEEKLLIENKIKAKSDTTKYSISKLKLKLKGINNIWSYENQLSTGYNKEFINRNSMDCKSLLKEILIQNNINIRSKKHGLNDLYNKYNTDRFNKVSLKIKKIINIGSK